MDGQKTGSGISHIPWKISLLGILLAFPSMVVPGKIFFSAVVDGTPGGVGDQTSLDDPMFHILGCHHNFGGARPGFHNPKHSSGRSLHTHYPDGDVCLPGHPCFSVLFFKKKQRWKEREKTVKVRSPKKPRKTHRDSSKPFPLLFLIYWQKLIAPSNI